MPPPVTEKIVQEALELGLTRVWMQPGAESPPAIERGEAAGIVQPLNPLLAIDRLVDLIETAGASRSPSSSAGLRGLAPDGRTWRLSIPGVIITSSIVIFPMMMSVRPFTVSRQA